jgi:hypothetical protein
MLRVAIATENLDHDGEIYRYLLARLLDVDVTQWTPSSPVRFMGWRMVRDQAPAYLERACRDGVRHALIAIDNDGGMKRAPEHARDHDVAAQATDQDGCRVCRLLNALSRTWIGGEGSKCIVVPVQTIETWLLVLRGFDFKEGSPERRFDRKALKRDFFGKPLPAERERTRLAIQQLERPDALAVLRERRSFRHFEAQVSGWT